MKNRTMKVFVSSALAALIFASVGPHQQVEAKVNMEQLITDAKNAGNVLKWAISIEGSADGVTQPWEQFNDAKTTISKAESALNEVGLSEKLKYESQLIDTKIQIVRAGGYLDAITASAKIHAKTKALSAAVNTNNLDKVEAAYHEMTKEFRKQTILLDRVYGQSTRDRIRNTIKGPAEKLIADLQNDVTVHMLEKGAAVDIRNGKYTEAAKKIYEAQAILSKNVLIWESDLQNRINNIAKSLPVQIESITRVDNTTVKLTLTRGISSVKSNEFIFDNSLTVTNVSLNNDGRTIILTTSVQTPGSSYTLKYKGNSVSFTVPGSVIPIYVGDKTIQHKETTEVIALAVSFKESNQQPSKATVRIDIPTGLKLVSINGVGNTTAGAKSVNATPDKNGTVTVVLTAKDLTSAALNKIITFNKIDRNKVVETQNSGNLNFYVAAKAGSIANKKVHFIDTYTNYFVSTDGLKYKLKPYGDSYWNEGTAVSLDAFKAALDLEDVVNGTYHPTSSSSLNIVNAKVASLALDSEFTYRTGTTGYRISGNKIELFGTGQPNYELFFFKDTAVYLGKTKVKSNGTWTYSTNVNQSAITDFAMIQQITGKAIPAIVGREVYTLRVIEGPFELDSISAGNSEDNNLTNEKLTFTIAPVKQKNTSILAQDQAVISKEATIIVKDSDGTRVKFTNNQRETNFNAVKNAFTIKFGSIDTNNRGGTIIDKGRDGKLSGPLEVISIEGLTNEYGLNLRINKGDQIKGY